MKVLKFKLDNQHLKRIDELSIQNFSIRQIFAEKLRNRKSPRLRIHTNVHDKMHKMHYSWGKFTIQDQYLRLLYTSLIGRVYFPRRTSEPI